MIAIENLAGQRVYLDTNVLIYLVEAHPAFVNRLSVLFDAIDGNTVEAITSELSLAEVLVKPMAMGNKTVAGIYERLLSAESKIDVVPVDRQVLIDSARVRADLGCRAFDAIHVATALRNRCDALLTEDARMRVPASMRLFRLSELAADGGRSTTQG